MLAQEYVEGIDLAWPTVDTTTASTRGTLSDYNDRVSTGHQHRYAERVRTLKPITAKDPHHPLHGLSIKAANTLEKAGYTDRAEILAAMENGELKPHLSIKNYGKIIHREVCKWLGISDPWGTRICPHCGGEL